MSSLTAKFLAYNCAKSYGDEIASSFFAEFAGALRAENSHEIAWLSFGKDLRDGAISL